MKSMGGMAFQVILKNAIENPTTIIALNIPHHLPALPGKPLARMSP